MFRSPNDPSSSVESDGETSDGGHMSAEDVGQLPRSAPKAAEDQQPKPLEDFQALAPKYGPFAQGSSAPAVDFPSLLPHQRQVLFHLTLLEGKCKSMAAKTL